MHHLCRILPTMSTIFRRILVTASLWHAISATILFAQVTSSFDELVQNHAALVSGGRPETEQVELVAGWVEANDWRSLPLANQAWLHSRLLALDQVNANAFSVRWSGTITAPATAAYVFTQHQLPSAYGGTLKLWIGETLILDTSNSPKRLGWGPELAPPAKDAYRSQPVNLAAGQAVPIRVDYVYHDEFPNVDDRFDHWRFPLPLLLWESPGMTQRIVAREAVVPPNDFGNLGDDGLRADYFNDTGFSNPIGSFIEPGVQLIWNKRVVLPRFKVLLEQILGEIRGRVLTPAAMSAEQAAVFMRESVDLVLPGLCAEDRELAIRNLSTNESLLRQLDPVSYAAWMPHVAMLPQPVHVTLLAAWSNYYDVPPPRIAPHSGYGPGSYADANYRAYGEAGLWLDGPGWPAAEQLINEHLQRSDGSCNLLVASVAGFGSRFESRPGPILRAIGERASDDKLPADTRVTWLVAQGFARELFIGGLPKPGLAIPSLEEALLIAESSDVRFRLFEEIVPRLASTGQTGPALEMVNAYGQQFTEPAQQTVVNRLRTEITTITELFHEEKTNSAARQAEASRTAYLKELRRRLDAATVSGDADLAAHYRRALLDAGVSVDEPPN